MEAMERERQRTLEMEEMMQREQERQQREEEEDQKRRERAERAEQIRREREEAKRKAVKEEEKEAGGGGGGKSNRSGGQGDLNFKGGDPLDHNEGDIDLEPHLKPLLGQAGGNVEKLGLEALRRALTDGTLLVVGVKLWSALHSETWRHREAAA